MSVGGEGLDQQLAHVLLIVDDEDTQRAHVTESSRESRPGVPLRFAERYGVVEPAAVALR
jgi:hypothetical protein